MNKETENINSINDARQDEALRIMQGKMARDIKSHMNNKLRAFYRHDMLVRKNIGNILSTKKTFKITDFSKLVNFEIKSKQVKQILNLTFIKELSQKEISKRLDITIKTVQRKRKAGQDRIKEALRTLYLDKLIDSRYITPIAGSSDHKCIESYKGIKRTKTTNWHNINKIEHVSNNPYKSSLHDKVQDFYYAPTGIKPHIAMRIKHIKAVVEPILTNRQTIDINKRRTIGAM